VIAWLLSAALAAPVMLDPSMLEDFEAPEGAVAIPEAWWSTLDDPLLDEAVERAAGRNFDVAAAWARIRAADANLWVTASGLLPSASFDANTTGQPLENVAFCAVGQPDFLNPPDADWCWQGSARLNARWQLDVFGRQATATRAAQLEVLAAKGDQRSQALAVSARVAGAYLDAVAARRQLAIVEEQLASQRELLEIIELRFEQGSASSVEVLQQRSAVSATEALLPPARLSKQVAEQALAVLLGFDPAHDVAIAEALPEPGLAPSPGTPEAMAAARPDLQSAMARYRASKASLTSAHLGLLPSLQANAAAGWSYVFAPDLDTLEGWSVGGTLSVPLFNGGAQHGRIRAARAQRDIAIHTYNQTLLDASSEVHSALARDREETTRREAVDRQLAAAELVHAEAIERYLAGIDTFLNVLTAQTSLQQAQLNSISAHRTVLSSRIDLFVALGGASAPSGATP
jgi:multidrug efflux system outer membrane protein